MLQNTTKFRELLITARPPAGGGGGDKKGFPVWKGGFPSSTGVSRLENDRAGSKTKKTENRLSVRFASDSRSNFYAIGRDRVFEMISGRETPIVDVLRPLRSRL